MAETVTVGVRYCGGCNPRFDRVAGVRLLEADCPWAAFTGAEPGVSYDLLLIVGGCTACCPDQSGLEGQCRVEIRTEDDFEQALALLRRAGEDRDDSQR